MMMLYEPSLRYGVKPDHAASAAARRRDGFAPIMMLKSPDQFYAW
jgi:hypothetical protein